MSEEMHDELRRRIDLREAATELLATPDDARAIEAATRELLTATRELVDCYRNVPYPPTVVLTLHAAADALATLIGVPS